MTSNDEVVDFLFFRKFVSRVQNIYRGFLMGGVVSCGVLVGSVFYSVHVTNQAAKDHSKALDGLKSEYAATSKSLKDEVDHLSANLIEKYREALNKLSGAYEEKFQALQKVHKSEVEELLKQLRLSEAKQYAAESREKALRESLSELEDIKKQLKVAEAKQHAAESREMALRRKGQ